MSRIVIAWELGENLGHLWNLLPVAQRLRSLGHDVSFGIRDVAQAHRYLAPLGLRWFAAPVAQGVPPLGRDVASHTDILAACGAAHATHLAGMVGAWRHLFDVLQPDLVLVEHAPFALLAANRIGVPTVHLGTGFTIAPTLAPAPNFRPWDSAMKDEVVQTGHRVALAVQQVFGGPYPLDECFRANETRLLSIPALDHYDGMRSPDAMFIGAMPAPESHGEPVEWKRDEVPRVFVYLRASPYLDAVLRLLDDAGAEVIATLPDVHPEQAARYRTLRIYDQPVRIDALLGRCDLAITHGGHGTALACLLAGVPMLALPMHIEQLRVTENVANAGAGLGILPAHVTEHFGPVLRTMLATQTFREAARAIAMRHSGLDPARALDGVVELIERAIVSRSPGARTVADGRESGPARH